MPVSAQNFNYPLSHKDNVIENYHGIKVADPYRWLEDPSSEQTKNWVEAENKVTFNYLNSVPAKEKIKERLTELWNYPKYSAPTKEGNNYFFFKNDGLQNQAVLYMQEKLKSTPKVLLDPNKLTSDGTAALSGQYYNKQGTLLAYGISKNGSDRQEIKIKKIATGHDYDEVLKWCKFSGVAWKSDNSGFYYNRYPEPGTVATEDLNNYSTVYWHTLGTSQDLDKLVYQDKDNKELSFFPFTSEDGKYLMLHIYKGTAPENNIYFRDINSDNSFKKLFNSADASYEYVDNKDNIIYIKTTNDSPKGRIITVDLNNPEKSNWKNIIPEQKEVMQSVHVINHQLIISYMHDAYNILKTYDMSGKFIGQIDLPTIGTVDAITGKKDDNEMFIKFSSFTYPSTTFTYNFGSGKLENFMDSEVKFKPADYETKQVFYNSKDGTKVPMFLTYKKGLKLNGDNPVLLYGYGGFDVSLTPSFSISRIVWMEHGGIFAMPNLRGGGEYGEEWHKAGMLEKKQNVFDDFISAGEWLIKNNYTNSKKLAINGGSNGGLLVAACMIQKPNLFGAVVCSVPVIDMLRYHKFTVGRYWIPEYGNAESNSADFKFMYAYSPLHNVKENVAYPPTLITTADTDDRVVPAHAKKFAATLQEIYKGNNPILIRIDTKAGHGAGKPTTK
ncbi:MAG: S9 family peptidase, partial [Candidatus Sericytochromatia bacterium]|nr:S9 family peptidase [Candidatus Sericytochromatia bacterium]